MDNTSAPSHLQFFWFVLAPAPLLLGGLDPINAWAPLRFFSLLATLFFTLQGITWVNLPRLSRISGLLALCFTALAGWDHLSATPMNGLLGGITLIATGFFICSPSIPNRSQDNSKNTRRYWAAKTSLYGLCIVAALSYLINPENRTSGELLIGFSGLLAQIPLLLWLLDRQKRNNQHWPILLPFFALGLLALSIFCSLTALAALLSSAFSLLFLAQIAHTQLPHQEYWWDPFLGHPARLLISTFFALCVFGTFLLQVPWAANRHPLSLLDAAFTAVSAVCVTGLTVVDTQFDFSGFGQGCLLLLIQLGGLGIMTITTVALHALGKRMSLHQERILTSLTETSHQELFHSLVTILRFTFWGEFLGALLLALGFFLAGSNWSSALWQGLFTSISAFCNAGFALNSDNLEIYQSSPLILHTVAVLIIAGGLAPSTCLLLPQWLRGNRLSLAPSLALVTTLVLLLSGFFAFLFFEWDHVLAGLHFSDKLSNSWFQSVTLRTAGFNSVDLSTVRTPTLVIMLLSMFIGGSPGGTAGGIKTTTVGILVLTFWATITGNERVTAGNRTITQAVINRTITVFFAGGFVWLFVVLALSLTQELAASQLIFEATSALGTAGLSLGATTHLDGIGKIIIMLTMFIGRIGPMTLFTLLSREHQSSQSRYPDAHIPLS